MSSRDDLTAAGATAEGLAGTDPAHHRLQSALSELVLTSDAVPDLASWKVFLALINDHCHQADQVHQDMLDAQRERSSFENLFNISPIPIIQQDYTLLEGWMDELRRRGVTSLHSHVGGDIDAIRAIVPMIHITAANPAAVEAVGLSHDQIIGPIDPQIVNPGSEEGWMTQLQAVWDKAPIARAAFTAATARGASYDAESVLAAPVIEGRPDFSRAVFTIIDVTAHRNEERRMQVLVADKDRFLASVSHEVRTPLTAILGFAQLLDDEPGAELLSEEERRSMISSIASHAQEVSDLVEDLLVAARAELGQVEVAATSVDVAAIVAQTLQAGGDFTDGVTFVAAAPEARATCDPVRLRQILRNLLTNAERYGGPEVVITIDVVDARVCVMVADDGPGLPRAEWDRIFDAYHRAHDTPGRPGSVGIGLSISRQLAELMGGELSYRHEDGKSVFRLCLPSAG